MSNQTKRLFLVTHGETEKDAGENPSLSALGKRQVSALRSSLLPSSMVTVASTKADRETARILFHPQVIAGDTDHWRSDDAMLIRSAICQLPDRAVICAGVECLLALGKQADELIDAGMYEVTVRGHDGMIECFLIARGRVSEPPPE